MPIRTKAFTQIALTDVQDLIDREVREDRTIEYKERVDLESREGKVEFLKHVTAFANAAGGTIVIGAVEGEGDRRGVIVAFRGLHGSPDALGLSIAAALRDGVDERLEGVLHRPIAVGDGTHLHIVRVPASPLAPHMIKLRTAEGRHYLRGNVSSDPMTARQIRELAIRTETAVVRAESVVEKRIGVLRERASRAQTRSASEGRTFYADQAVLHVASLFPRPGGWAFHSEETTRRMC